MPYLIVKLLHLCKIQIKNVKNKHTTTGQMSTYIITFEINNAAKLVRLKEQIKSLCPTYCPIHNNAWAVLSSLTATTIRDNLMTSLDVSDRLFVIRSGTEAAWLNSYGELNNNWLKERL